jgi:putative inorganic carbon (hco3(-)) transporter
MLVSTEQSQLQGSRPAELFPGTVQERPSAADALVSALVTALLSPFLALRARIVQKILFATVILDIPLQLGTTFFHRPADADLGAFRGLSISATTLALLGLYGSWFVEALAGKNPKRHSALHVNVPLTLYVAIAMCSLCVAQDITLSLFELFLFAQLYLVYFYVANRVRTREEVRFVVALLLLGALLESLMIIALKFSNLGTSVIGPAHIYVESDPTTGGTRIGGTMGPNVAGAYLSVLLALAVSVLFTNLKRIDKWMAAAVLMLGQIAILLTFSRGAWMALVVAISGLCIVACREGWFSWKLPVTAILIFALLYAPFGSAVSTRLFGDDNGAAESRIPLMNVAFRIISDSPILGVGSNNFSVVMERYLTSEFRQPRAFVFIVHNKYLLIWAETGIIGLLAFLAFLAGALRKGWQCWKFQDRLFSPVALGCLAGVAGHMLHMAVDHFRNRPAQQLLWLIAGLFVAMHRILREETGGCDSFSSIT